MKSSKLSPLQVSLGRRALLRNLGFATAGALTGSAWERAHAAENGKPPTRIIFLYTENGTLQSAWKPAPVAGKQVATENEWELGELHAPILKDYKKDLIYIENLDLISTDLDLSPFGGSHQRMQVHMLNGANRLKAEVAGAATIDQFIAKEINKPKAVTAFPSLEYAVSSGYYHDQLVSWSGPGMYVPPEASPLVAYDRIFKLASGPNNDAAAQAAAKEARKRKLMFDTLKTDFSTLQSGLSGHSKAKIEAHRSVFSDLESRLSLGQTATCNPPMRQSAVGIQDNLHKDQNKTSGWWNGAGDIFSRMAVAALACDLTRVVTIELSTPPESITGYKGDIHLGWVHSTAGDNSLAELRAMPGYDDMTRYHRWYAQQFANLIGMLKAIPEGEPGQTMLDHTVIYWFGPMGQGNHDPHQMPYVLAGSANGYFRTNRYLKFNRRPATDAEKQIDKLDGDKAETPSTRGVPHNNLLVSLVNAMGIPITTYGNPACCTGPLTGLH